MCELRLSLDKNEIKKDCSMTYSPHNINTKLDRCWGKTDAHQLSAEPTPEETNAHT